MMSVAYLTKTEQHLVEATSRGESVDLTPDSRCGDDGSIRAQVITDLLTGRLGAETSYPISLSGASIAGLVNLDGGTVVRPMYLHSCEFSDVPQFSDAETKTLSFIECLLPGLRCVQARVNGSIRCKGCKVTGVVDVVGVKVDGVLDLGGATVEGLEGVAIDARSATVGGNVLLRNGFSATGEVRFAGARVGCKFEVSRASLSNDGGPALVARLLTVEQDMYLTELDVEGEVTLTRARIGGGLNLRRSSLRNQGGYALAGRWLAVGRDLVVPSATIHGELRLVDANIDGSLDLGGATLRTPTGECLNAHGISVGGSVYCGRMVSDPDKATVFEGRVDLSDAKVDAHVDFRHTDFAHCPIEESLNLARMRAIQLRLQPATKPPGAVTLVNAHVCQYYDDPTTWPDVVRLRGFEYDVLDSDQVGVRKRIHCWLQGQDTRSGSARERLRRWWNPRDDTGYLPSAYDQLAAAYRRAGRVQATKMVGLAKLRHRRRALHPVPRFISFVIDVTVGYGYRKRWAVLWFVGLTAVGTFACWLLERGHYLIAVGTHSTVFNPFAYAVDVIVPIVDLGQQRYWLPEGPAIYCTLLLSVGGWALLTLVATGMSNILKRD